MGFDASISLMTPSDYEQLQAYVKEYNELAKRGYIALANGYYRNFTTGDLITNAIKEPKPIEEVDFRNCWDLHHEVLALKNVKEKTLQDLNYHSEPICLTVEDLTTLINTMIAKYDTGYRFWQSIAGLALAGQYLEDFDEPIVMVYDY